VEKEPSSAFAADGEPPAPPFDPLVCPRCFGENTPLQNFCVHCGAPAYGIATTGPLETGISHGWAMGEAAARTRPSWVVSLGGILLLSVFLLPVAVVALWAAAEALIGTSRRPTPAWQTALTGSAGLFVLGLWILAMARLLRNLRDRAVEPPEEDLPDDAA
jgi:hypothetical protein